MSDAYAKAGVDYSKLEPFKMAMIEAGKRTVTFPNKRGVHINADVMHSHGAVYEYRGKEQHVWVKTQEGLGNKNWIAEWMYAKTGKSYYDSIGIDTALMAANDCIAQGAMPVVFTDHIDAGDSEWFSDEVRSKDLADGFYRICKETGMALPAGESAPLKYLIKSEPPVKSAPSLSGSVTGIVAPASRLITGKKLAAGDVIIGATSSGLHANGISLLISEVMKLPEQFLTKLPSGKIIGEEALTPTRSYVALVEALQENDVDIHALLPATGDGIGKIAYDKRAFTYRIRDWPQVPELFKFIQSKGVPLEDCLKTFNWGVGYYVFVPQSDVDKVLAVGGKAGYELLVVGVVEEGERQTVFEPEGIILNPPGE